jgi:hypothetical protein
MVENPVPASKSMAGCGLMRLLPDEFWAHRRAARRERLLACRSLLDSAIEHLEETPTDTGTASTGEPKPDGFWAHHRAAHREDLLALRSLVDSCVHWLEKPAPAERATRIDVL